MLKTGFTIVTRNNTYPENLWGLQECFSKEVTEDFPLEHLVFAHKNVRVFEVLLLSSSESDLLAIEEHLAKDCNVFSTTRLAFTVKSNVVCDFSEENYLMKGHMCCEVNNETVSLHVRVVQNNEENLDTEIVMHIGPDYAQTFQGQLECVHQSGS
jgi:hypothetical protein